VRANTIIAQWERLTFLNELKKKLRG